MTTLVSLLICALVFIGFITNAVPWTSFNFGTLVVDILYVLIGCLSVLRIRSVDRERLKALRTPLILYAVYSAWCLFLMFYGDNSFRDRVMGFRNNVIYPGIWIPLALLGRAVSFRRVAAIIFYGGLASCVLAIIQAFFSADMPELLLTLHGTDKHFGFYGTDIFRVTGIVGNPLVFSGFSSFMVLLGYMFLSFEARRRARFLIWLPLIAMYYTYTRTSNVALLLTWGFAWSIWTTIPLWRRFVRIAFVLTFLAVMLFGGCFGPELFRSNFFFSRMSGTEITSQGSTEDHIKAAIGGLAAWAMHPICGLGIGSQGYSVKDHTGTFGGDGAYLALLLETGGVGFVLAFAIMAWFLWRIMFRFAASPRAGPSFRMYGALLLTAGYFAMASVLNSAFTVRTNMCLYWILVGVMFSRPAGRMKDDDGRWWNVFVRVLSGSGGSDSALDADCVADGGNARRCLADTLNVSRNLMLTRDQIWVLIAKDFKLKYNSTALGFVWSLLVPTLTSAVYYFVFGIMIRFDTPNYLLYLMSGTFLWQFFGNVVMMNGIVLYANQGLLKKTSFDRSLLVRCTFYTESIHFFLTIPVILALMVFYRQMPDWVTLVPNLAVCLVSLYLLSIGISYVYAACNIFFRDLERIMGLLLMMWMFCSPVFIPVTAFPPEYRFVLDYNPMAMILQLWRDIFYMPTWHPELYLRLALSSLVFFFIGRSVFRKMEPRFAEMM